MVPTFTKNNFFLLIHVHFILPSDGANVLNFDGNSLHKHFQNIIQCIWLLCLATFHCKMGLFLNKFSTCLSNSTELSSFCIRYNFLNQYGLGYMSVLFQTKKLFHYVIRQT